jgi:uncharacterized membrane protein
MTPPALASLRDALGDRWDALRTQLWPLPVAGVACAIGAGVALPRLDAHVDPALAGTTSFYLFGGSADAARTVLGAIAGSLITVTSLTFSLTVVTLQLASSQFSPRLLRTFTRDRFVHVTLALFLAAFTFALTVLRTVHTDANGQHQFVPKLSVTVAFLLALASVVVLVLFLAHLVSQIRVETMLREVHADASDAIASVLTRPAGGRPEAVALPRPPPAVCLVTAARSGFLTRIDEQAVLAAANRADAVVVIDRHPGASLIAGTPIGAAWPSTGAPFTDECRDRLLTGVSAAVSTGFERTAVQDVALGLRQLTDVANKALSPGINDPTTAVHALGHCAALLCEMAAHDLGPRILTGPDGDVRVILHRPDLADLLDLAISQPRRYGAADPDVLTRLLHLLRELAWSTHTPGHRRAVADQLARLRATAMAQHFDAHERAGLREAADDVEAALDHRWTRRDPE